MKHSQRKTWLIAGTAIVLAALFIYAGQLAWQAYVQHRFQAYLNSPIPVTTNIQLTIPSGAPVSTTAKLLADNGVIAKATALQNALVILGQDRQVKAGHYQFTPGTSHQELINKLVAGDFHLEKFRIIEGTTFAQILANLAATKELTISTAALTPSAAWQQLAPSSEYAAEGMLMPDTYLFAAQSSDTEILQQAQQRLTEMLAKQWAGRSADLPLANAYEALILASIVEKETGVAAERDVVASVFINRLRRGMRLQSDPTVIYGLGDEFAGNLTKKHLQTDTPYNTYTRAGLPPTPIAMVSAASLHATLHPAETEYYYFVADGSGGHKFSKTLREHNNAVNKYQR